MISKCAGSLLGVVFTVVLCTPAICGDVNTKYTSKSMDRLSSVTSTGLNASRLSGLYDGVMSADGGALSDSVPVPPTPLQSANINTAYGLPALPMRGDGDILQDALDLMGKSPTGKAICSDIVSGSQACSVNSLEASHVHIVFGKFTNPDILGQTNFNPDTKAITVTLCEDYRNAAPALTAIVLAHELVHAEARINYPLQNVGADNTIVRETDAYIQEMFVANDLAVFLPESPGSDAPLKLLGEAKLNAMNYAIWKANMDSPFLPPVYTNISAYALECSILVENAECMDFNRSLSSDYEELQKQVKGKQSISILEAIAFYTYRNKDYPASSTVPEYNLHIQAEYQHLLKRLLLTTFPQQNFLCGVGGQQSCSDAPLEKRVFTLSLGLEQACAVRPDKPGKDMVSLISRAGDSIYSPPLSGDTLKYMSGSLFTDSCMIKLISSITASKVGFRGLTAEWLEYVFAYNFPSPPPDTPTPYLPPIEPCKPGSDVPDNGNNASTGPDSVENGTPWLSRTGGRN